MPRLAIATLALFLLASPGCREEGPAEQAGRRLDETVEKLRHGDEGALERMGRKADEAVEEAKKALEESRQRE